MTLQNITLFPWQKEAVQSFLQQRHGIIKAFTGSGKSLMGLASYFQLQQDEPTLKLVIVVPQIPLAQQWKNTIMDLSSISESEIGILGGNQNDSLVTKRILIAVINSAYKKLPKMTQNIDNKIMLLVDECHRSVSDKNCQLFTMKRAYTLGLSATPEREEFDEDGELLSIEEQKICIFIGPVVFSFSLKMPVK